MTNYANNDTGFQTREGYDSISFSFKESHPVAAPGDAFSQRPNAAGYAEEFQSVFFEAKRQQHANNFRPRR